MELQPDIKDWGVDEVYQFLRREGFQERATELKDNQVTGVQLLDLNNLRDLVGDDYTNIRKAMKKHMESYCSKVFNDPIHGHIEFHPLLVKIIDTPEFQRLRHIKQLGGAYYVYPGAPHNRFEHSIGVGHLAGELTKALKSKQPELDISDEDILCVQIAGLCHDLGHGPFSHLYDGMFIPKACPCQRPRWKHEKASVDMFDHLVKKNDLEKTMELYGLDLRDDCIFIKEMILAQREWPYEGRGEDKSFLYEIVSNKRNGIDVDKFDYFARDCHNLGFKNNFDHLRFITFARVIEVDGQKHICSRDKEMANLYDMFNARNAIHRRACYHKVTTNIQIMIKDAFLKADEHLMLSSAKDDMEAYTKLTDEVMEQILHSSSAEMGDARSILQRIVSRDLYIFVGEAKKKDNKGITAFVTQAEVNSLKQELARPSAYTHGEEDNFEVVVIKFDYGNNEENPMENTFFYTKTNPSKGFKIPREQASKLLPSVFSEEVIRVYWKNKEDNRRLHAKKRFQNWCQRNGFINAAGERALQEEDNGGASGNTAGQN